MGYKPLHQMMHTCDENEQQKIFLQSKKNKFNKI